MLTAPLIEHLAKPGDFEPLLHELEALGEETRNGRFHSDNVLQRDLELKRFAWEYKKANEGAPSQPAESKSRDELYRVFVGLEELPQPEGEEWSPGSRDLAEAKRAAYEAWGLLKFLRELKAASNRPIVVVGNDRYGRQWVVEPIHGLLRDGFAVRYDRVSSHMSMRLTVASARFGEASGENDGRPWSPNAFPMEFVREISEHMPHIVVVDGTVPVDGPQMMRFPRSMDGYVNWFVAFNDIRAGGDLERYRHESCVPLSHIPELMRWHEFVKVRRQLREWVAPGPTYKVTLWTPEPSELAQLGDFTVAGEPPDLASERPQVVIANPIIYRTEGEDLPEALRGTQPYYFDGPERFAKEKVVFGFGPHGFETRVEGTTTATYVTAVQKSITAEVEALIAT